MMNEMRFENKKTYVISNSEIPPMLEYLFCHHHPSPMYAIKMQPVSYVQWVSVCSAFRAILSDSSPRQQLLVYILTNCIIILILGKPAGWFQG